MTAKSNCEQSSNAETRRLVEDLFRRESGRLTALLTSRFGTHRFELVEDVVQETLLRALKHWSFHGVPDFPSAWMTLTARNLILDALRREKKIVPWPKEWDAAEEPRTAQGEDRIRLMFATCDPLMPLASQIALTLHTLGGLSTKEIAACLCCEPNAVDQRVSRAKKHLRLSQDYLSIPDDSELPERLDAVLQVLYQIFAAGYAARSGSTAVKIDLCTDALYLIRLVRESPKTDTPAARALEAVMYFYAARLPSRTDDEGNVVRFEDQDRSLWDKALTHKAFQAFESSMTGHRLSSFHLEAAILAEHSKATSVRDTDWGAVLAFYDDLIVLSPSPGVRIGRAIAIGFSRGPAAALEELEISHRLEPHAAFHASRSRFLSQLGRQDEAKAALQRAAELTRNDAEQAHFRERLAAEWV